MSAPAAAVIPGVVLEQAVRRFAASCRCPQLLEPGDPVFTLQDTCWSVAADGNRARIEAWDRDHFLNRRIRGIRSQSSNRMELITERFGGRTGVLHLYDAFRASNQGVASKGRRLVFGSLLRTMLARRFPGWRTEHFSTEANLEQSLGPAYPRALVCRGKQAWAVIASPPTSGADGVLAAGLVWLDYLRKHRCDLIMQGLQVFLPQGSEGDTCLRIACLDAKAARYHVLTYTKDGAAEECDAADHGNIKTRLSLPATSTGRIATGPEESLEARLRAAIQSLDPRLQSSPVYGQVPAFAGTGRGILDLLGVDHWGRLTVIELKATESMNLPLQALDYWLRVKWHLERGDFQRHGYFPGIALSSEPPRLLLAAPALRFHPTTERLVRFFHPDIEVEQIGLSDHGSIAPRVLFRQGR
ncbi:MAG: hypothetical protein HYZ37_12940 [Candidatus Solibacter usitatus]|nr:hypothetical protein [Candidatus Solibacter usitatus]